MRIQEFSGGGQIRALKFRNRDAPHATIETNRTCNIRCRCCYNLAKYYVKPLAEIRAEIDLLMAKRKLQVLTILGGEPTLHPDLPAVVAYVKSKKILCQLLTNGIRFLEDAADGFLDELVSAGVDKIVVHVDSGQGHVHDNPDEARNRIFERLEKKKIPFSLAVTIYNGEAGILPGLAKTYSRFRHFDGILAVLARDAVPPVTQTVEMADVCRNLHRDLGLRPATYIPSCQDDNYVSWMIYHYFIHPETGTTFAFSPRLDVVFRKLYRLARGRQFFITHLDPDYAIILFIAAALAEVTLRTKNISAVLRFIRNLSVLKAIRFHYLAVQAPPEIHEPGKPVHICFQCPDATIRHGRLTPVCLADLINPINATPGMTAIREDLYQLAYGHLGEISIAG